VVIKKSDEERRGWLLRNQARKISKTDQTDKTKNILCSSFANIDEHNIAYVEDCMMGILHHSCMRE
jgi:hypothetical protein